MPPRLRTFLRETLTRSLDLPAELADWLGGRTRRLPPPALRYATFGTSSRRTYLAFGERLAGEVVAALAAEQGERSEPVRVLDFACGCGRVARALQELLPTAAMTGVDVNPDAVDWCAKNLRGDYRLIEPHGPLPFGDATFTVACAFNVFTHMSEPEQLQALQELHRVLRPGGLLVVTTRSPESAGEFQLEESDLVRLRTRGFAYFPQKGGQFAEHRTFHSADYLAREWSPWFAIVRQRPHTLPGRDLTVLRRAETES